ncbi:MAG: hypothetical protein QOF24_419 [Verrucomicrobiota bacterium]|jgi:hypothetical protein
MNWRRIIRSVGRGSLRDLARWLFLATLVAAPWLYGGTTAWSIEITSGSLALVLAFWAASLLLDWRWPFLSRGLAIIAGVILLLGWWMVANANAIYDPTFRNFVPVGAIWSAMPGSADYVLSFAWMLRTTALIGVTIFVADLSRRPAWLLRLWHAVAIAGGSIAFLGLIQKGTGAEMMFWQSAPERNKEIYPFFATYYYHANAGAFLNLVLPPVGGLALWTMARQSSAIARATWITTLVLIAVAIFSNTSRMAQAVSVILGLAMIAAVARPAARMMVRAEKRVLIVGVLVVTLTAIAIGQAAHLDRAMLRWQQITTQLPLDARWAADRVALGGVGDAGWFGFGPGTFQAIFPHYQREVGNGLRGTWRFLHEDYLQTILEWGWFGSASIAALFFGGIAAALHNYFKAGDWNNRQRILLPCAVLALAGVALHALVDFPLQILSIQLFVATYLGICWGSSRWKVSEVRSQKSQPISNNR